MEATRLRDDERDLVGASAEPAATKASRSKPPTVQRKPSIVASIKLLAIVLAVLLGLAALVAAFAR